MAGMSEKITIDVSSNTGDQAKLVMESFKQIAASGAELGEILEAAATELHRMNIGAKQMREVLMTMSDDAEAVEAIIKRVTTATQQAETQRTAAVEQGAQERTQARKAEAGEARAAAQQAEAAATKAEKKLTALRKRENKKREDSSAREAEAVETATKRRAEAEEMAEKARTLRAEAEARLRRSVEDKTTKYTLGQQDKLTKKMVEYYKSRMKALQETVSALGPMSGRNVGAYQVQFGDYRQLLREQLLGLELPQDRLAEGTAFLQQFADEQRRVFFEQMAKGFEKGSLTERMVPSDAMQGYRQWQENKDPGAVELGLAADQAQKDAELLRATAEGLERDLSSIVEKEERLREASRQREADKAVELEREIAEQRKIMQENLTAADTEEEEARTEIANEGATRRAEANKKVVSTAKTQAEEVTKAEVDAYRERAKTLDEEMERRRLAMIALTQQHGTLTSTTVKEYKKGMDEQIDKLKMWMNLNDIDKKTRLAAVKQLKGTYRTLGIEIAGESLEQGTITEKGIQKFTARLPAEAPEPEKQEKALEYRTLRAQWTDAQKGFGTSVDKSNKKLGDQIALIRELEATNQRSRMQLEDMTARAVHQHRQELMAIKEKAIASGELSGDLDRLIRKSMGRGKRPQSEVARIWGPEAKDSLSVILDLEEKLLAIRTRTEQKVREQGKTELKRNQIRIAGLKEENRLIEKTGDQLAKAGVKPHELDRVRSMMGPRDKELERLQSKTGSRADRHFKLIEQKLVTNEARKNRELEKRLYTAQEILQIELKYIRAHNKIIHMGAQRLRQLGMQEAAINRIWTKRKDEAGVRSRIHTEAEIAAQGIQRLKADGARMMKIYRADEKMSQQDILRREYEIAKAVNARIDAEIGKKTAWGRPREKAVIDALEDERMPITQQMKDRVALDDAERLLTAEVGMRRQALDATKEQIAAIQKKLSAEDAEKLSSKERRKAMRELRSLQRRMVKEQQDIATQTRRASKAILEQAKAANISERALARLEKRLNRAGDVQQSTGKRTKRSSKQLAGLGRIAKRLLGPVGAGFTAFMLLRKGISAVSKAAIEFENSMAQVHTLLPSSRWEIKQLGDEIRKMSLIMAVKPEDLAGGLYQVISSGFSDPQDAKQVLRASSQLAVAGRFDPYAAVDALTTVMNAYNMSADMATDTTDVFFRTVERGKLTVKEMAQHVGTVATTAAQAGISTRELGASIAALTAQGIHAPEATIALNQLLRDMMAPKPETIKLARQYQIPWSAAGLKEHGLIGVMRELKRAGEQAPEDRVLSRMMTNVRVFRAGTVLASQAGFDHFAKTMEMMESAAGATGRAFAKVSRTIEAKKQRIQNDMLDTWDSFGRFWEQTKIWLFQAFQVLTGTKRSVEEQHQVELGVLGYDVSREGIDERIGAASRQLSQGSIEAFRNAYYRVVRDFPSYTTRDWRTGEDKVHTAPDFPSGQMSPEDFGAALRTALEYIEPAIGAHMKIVSGETKEYADLVRERFQAQAERLGLGGHGWGPDIGNREIAMMLAGGKPSGEHVALARNLGEALERGTAMAEAFGVVYPEHRVETPEHITDALANIPLLQFMGEPRYFDDLLPSLEARAQALTTQEGNTLEQLMTGTPAQHEAALITERQQRHGLQQAVREILSAVEHSIMVDALPQIEVKIGSVEPKLVIGPDGLAQIDEGTAPEPVVTMTPHDIPFTAQDAEDRRYAARFRVQGVLSKTGQPGIEHLAGMPSGRYDEIAKLHFQGLEMEASEVLGILQSSAREHRDAMLEERRHRATVKGQMTEQQRIQRELLIDETRTRRQALRELIDDVRRQIDEGAFPHEFVKPQLERQLAALEQQYNLQELPEIAPRWTPPAWGDGKFVIAGVDIDQKEAVNQLDQLANSFVKLDEQRVATASQIEAGSAEAVEQLEELDRQTNNTAVAFRDFLQAAPGEEWHLIKMLKEAHANADPERFRALVEAFETMRNWDGEWMPEPAKSKKAKPGQPFPTMLEWGDFTVHGQDFTTNEMVKQLAQIAQAERALHDQRREAISEITQGNKAMEAELENINIRIHNNAVEFQQWQRIMTELDTERVSELHEELVRIFGLTDPDVLPLIDDLFAAPFGPFKPEKQDQAITDLDWGMFTVGGQQMTTDDIVRMLKEDSEKMSSLNQQRVDAARMVMVTEGTVDEAGARQQLEDTTEQLNNLQVAGRETAKVLHQDLAARVKELRAELIRLGVAPEKLDWLFFEEGANYIGQSKENMDDLIATWKEWATVVQKTSRALLRIGDGLDIIGADSRKAIQGVVDLGASVIEATELMRARKEPGADLGASAWIGPIAAGVAAVGTIIGAIFKSRSAAEAQREKLLREQNEAMRKLRISLDELRKTTIAQKTVSDIESDIATVEGAIIDRNVPAWASGLTEYWFKKVKRDELSTRVLNALERIAEVTGMSLDDLFDEEGNIRAQQMAEMLTAIKDLDFGVFAKDLQGQFEAMRFIFQSLGDDAFTAGEKIEKFIETLRKFSPTAADALAEAMKKDPAEAKKQLEEWAKVLGGDDAEARKELLESLGITAEELRNVIDTGLGLLGAEATSKNVQVGRSITEIQAVEVIAWLEDIAKTLHQLRDGLLNDRVSAMAASHTYLGNGQSAGQASMRSGVTIGTVNIGDIKVGLDENESTFQWFWSRLGEEVYRTGRWPGASGGFNG